MPRISFLLFSLSLVLVACSPPINEDLVAVAVATFPVVDGSPEAVGLLSFLNDPATDLDVLDNDVPLDRRAATHLIAARQQLGSFDSVADVDNVYWVGSAAITKMVQFADAEGYVPGPNDLLGTWDGVAFTVEQAALTLEIVINDLDHTGFDIYMGLDRRAADSIVAAQPSPSRRVDR